MKKTIYVVSLFDGISGIQLALLEFMQRCGFKVVVYASEVDEKAMKITQANFPDTIQLGDIRDITKDMIPHKVFMVTGGSPCQDFSIAGTKNGMEADMYCLYDYLELKKEGFKFKGQSYLYWEYVRVLWMLNPTYFLLENVTMKGKGKKWEHMITNSLNVEPIKINSNLVTAQNRERLYWTNIPGVQVPEDDYIYLSDIIPGAVAGYGFGGTPDGKGGYTKQVWTMRKDNKANCLVKSIGNREYVMFEDGTYRKLTPTEYERLQGLPEGYTDVPGVSMTARKGGIGNGWSIPVIEHILSYIPEFQHDPEKVWEEFEISG